MGFEFGPQRFKDLAFLCPWSVAWPNHIPHISKRLLKRGSFIIKQPIKFNQGLPLCAIKALLSTQTIKDDDKKFLLLQNLNRIHLSTRKDGQLKSSKESSSRVSNPSFQKSFESRIFFLFLTEEIPFTVSRRAPDKEAWPSPHHYYS